MKKICSIILLAISTILVLNFMVLADNKVIFAAEKITDINELEERAKNGVTDIPGFKLTDENNSWCTVQKLKTEHTSDGKIVNSYVATEFITLGYGEQYYETSWDSTSSAQIAIQVYFNSVYFEENFAIYDLYDIEEVWGIVLQHVDPTVTRVRMELKIHNFGHRYEGASLSGYLGVNGYSAIGTVNHPGVNVWYGIVDGEDNVFYNCAPDGSHVACQVKLYLQRGSEWEVHINFMKGDFLDDWF